MSVSEETYAAAKKLAEHRSRILSGKLDPTAADVAGIHMDLSDALLATILSDEDLELLDIAANPNMAKE